MSKVKISSKTSKVIITIFLIVCFCYYLFILINSSVFLKGRDKINVIFYGPTTKFYSLDRKNTNYLLVFPNSTKVLVPGGYDRYRIGAIGKLASLEKKPEIIRKTFSVATSTMVDLYFFEKKTTIYYDDHNSEKPPNFFDIFLTNSNANFVDRLFLGYIFSTNSKDSYQSIDLTPFESSLEIDNFDYNSFYKKFQGSFFQRSYRKYDINVQILYPNSYKTAQMIGQLIEGEGIRVVDLSAQEQDIGGCLLIAKKDIIATKTFERLRDFFKCQTKVGETTVSDIILELGSLEKDWAIK